MSEAPESSTRRSRRWQLIFSMCFVVGLATPLMLTSVNLARGNTAGEGPLGLTPAPPFPRTLKEAVHLPGAFEWYFTERFESKRWLLWLHGWFETHVLATSPNTAVLLGKSGWLFLRSERALDYYRQSEPLGDPQLRQWAAILAARQRGLGAAGIRYAFVVAPNKHTIYPEFLPDNIAPRAMSTRVDQLRDAVARWAPNVEFIDLRQVLAPYAEQLPLYFKTDTHWTPVAAWIASQQVARRLGLPLPPQPLLPWRSVATEGGDLARLIGLESDYVDDAAEPAAHPVELVDEQGAPVFWQRMDVKSRDRVVVLNSRGKGRAVVFRDSFGEAMIPWISGMFERTVWIWSYEYSALLVQQERPDVVIEQLVERKLMSLKSPGGGLSE